jgi:hypothetical protein
VRKLAVHCTPILTLLVYSVDGVDIQTIGLEDLRTRIVSTYLVITGRVVD